MLPGGGDLVLGGPSDVVNEAVHAPHPILKSRGDGLRGECHDRGYLSTYVDAVGLSCTHEAAQAIDGVGAGIVALGAKHIAEGYLLLLDRPCADTAVGVGQGMEQYLRHDLHDPGQQIHLSTVGRLQEAIFQKLGGEGQHLTVAVQVISHRECRAVQLVQPTVDGRQVGIVCAAPTQDTEQ